MQVINEEEQELEEAEQEEEEVALAVAVAADPGSLWSFLLQVFSCCMDFFCDTGTAFTSTWTGGGGSIKSF